MNQGWFSNKLGYGWNKVLCKTKWRVLFLITLDIFRWHWWQQLWVLPREKWRAGGVCLSGLPKEWWIFTAMCNEYLPGKECVFTDSSLNKWNVSSCARAHQGLENKYTIFLSKQHSDQMSEIWNSWHAVNTNCILGKKVWKCRVVVLIRNKIFWRSINLHLPILYDRFVFLVPWAVLLIFMSLLNSCKFAV